MRADSPMVEGVRPRCCLGCAWKGDPTEAARVSPLPGAAGGCLLIPPMSMEVCRWMLCRGMGRSPWLSSRLTASEPSSTSSIYRKDGMVDQWLSKCLAAWGT